MIFMTTFDWILLTVIVGITCAMLITYMDHRRKMAMIEMNIKLEEPYKQWHLLISGFSIAAIGLGLLIGFLQIREQSQLINAKEPGFITSLVLLTFGGALTGSHYLIRQRRKTMERNAIEEALRRQLDQLKGEKCRIKADGAEFTGEIQKIHNGKLLELTIVGRSTYIPVNRIISVEQIS